MKKLLINNIAIKFNCFKHEDDMEAVSELLDTINEILRDQLPDIDVQIITSDMFSPIDIDEIQTMAKKQFKIGECAIGGIISVDITGKVIQVKALDYFTKKVVSSGTELSTDDNAERNLDEYLNDLTTCYNAEKILEWIKSKITLK